MGYESNFSVGIGSLVGLSRKYCSQLNENIYEKCIIVGINKIVQVVN